MKVLLSKARKAAMPRGKRDEFTSFALKMKKGDLKAGEKIFNYFSPKIYRYVMVRTLNREIAEDLTQEIFLKVVSRLETFDENKGNFAGWIWQITKNSLKDHYAKKKVLPLSDLSPNNKFLIDEKPEYLDKAKVYEIFELIKNFTAEEQEIFSLRYVSDLSYKNLSKITGKSEGALRVAVCRLNKKIRQIIND